MEDDDRPGIARVHVTCEGPEYWELLAESSDDGRARVHALYESLLGCPVPESDLFYPADAYILDGSTRIPVGGHYDRFNIWNTYRGAIHLTQVNNTLGAEVNLAARAAIPRHGYRTPANDTSGITLCGGWGAPDRDSDPHIGAAANAFVRNGYRISLTDPVGLYISDLTATTLRLPDPYVGDEGRADIPDGVSERSRRLVAGRSPGRPRRRRPSDGSCGRSSSRHPGSCSSRATGGGRSGCPTCTCATTASRTPARSRPRSTCSCS